jgi:hypothetical protein
MVTLSVPQVSNASHATLYFWWKLSGWGFFSMFVQLSAVDVPFAAVPETIHFFYLFPLFFISASITYHSLLARFVAILIQLCLEGEISLGLGVKVFSII